MKLMTRFPAVLFLSAAAIFSPLTAQTVSDDDSPEASLNIPGGGQLFGKNDPNVRRATAIVNGEIITGTDIDHRLALTLAANETEIPASEVERIRAQILQNLVDETLQIQEAKANEIEVTDAEVEEYYARITQQNFKRSVKDNDAYLVSIGSSGASLRRQIKGELAWSRLIRRNVEPGVSVSDDEVNAIIERINANKGQPEYNISEIYLSATPENEQQVAETVKQIFDQLRQGGSFVAYARQFSEASTAVVGGDLGWVNLGQLPTSMAQAAAEMASGEIRAVPTPGGISIMVLKDKRQVATADVRDSLLSLKQIALNFAPGTSAEQARPLVERFQTETQKISGCGAADEMAKNLNAEVVNRDNVRVRDLPGPLQQVMLDLQVGQSTPPYGSLEDGVRVFVMCGRDAPPDANAPSFEQIMRNIEDDRVNKRARLYLRDLRRDAIIS
ncbi:peptidylprolyl isomerase [Sphingorhabdus arenilitoris]|uniref:Parvulin-like PPIase n=1 Tax=Sphingorhabdus arenilitoris TaxID=1490041 RepID=A0ABV8RGP3_9SPHN